MYSATSTAAGILAQRRVVRHGAVRDRELGGNAGDASAIGVGSRSRWTEESARLIVDDGAVRDDDATTGSPDAAPAGKPSRVAGEITLDHAVLYSTTVES